MHYIRLITYFFLITWFLANDAIIIANDIDAIPPITPTIMAKRIELIPPCQWNPMAIATIKRIITWATTMRDQGIIAPNNSQILAFLTISIWLMFLFLSL